MEVDKREQILPHGSECERQQECVEVDHPLRLLNLLDGLLEVEAWYVAGLLAKHVLELALEGFTERTATVGLQFVAFLPQDVERRLSSLVLEVAVRSLEDQLPRKLGGVESVWLFDQ